MATAPRCKVCGKPHWGLCSTGDRASRLAIVKRVVHGRPVEPMPDVETLPRATPCDCAKLRADLDAANATIADLRRQLDEAKAALLALQTPTPSPAGDAPSGKAARQRRYREAHKADHAAYMRSKRAKAKAQPAGGEA